ncbi:MAG TPA: BON domain-containing protein [Gammaproteobacteria bacterium]|nr:BON domain-containing protein [Gammaproteobacteria bacterium]
MEQHQELTSALLAAFEKDPDINLHESAIRVSYRENLRLEGQVANIIVKRKARRIATQLSGLSDIEDRMRLRPGQVRIGKALLDAVVNALSQEPAFRDFAIHAVSRGDGVQDVSGWVGVAVDDCQVRLDGMVNSLSHRRLAEVIAWWVPGTCDVHNHIRVQPAEKDTDDELTDAIMMVLEKDPMLHAETISPHVKARIVTLTGTVHSQEQRRMAIYDCWYVAGVHDVNSELQLVK